MPISVTDVIRHRQPLVPYANFSFLTKSAFKSFWDVVDVVVGNRICLVRSFRRIYPSA